MAKPGIKQTVPDKIAAGRASGVKLFARFIQMRNHCKFIPIGRGPGYQRPPQVSHSRAPAEIMLLLNKVKIRAEREEEGE